MSTKRSTLAGRDNLGSPLSGRRYAIMPSDHADRGFHFRAAHAALADRLNTPFDIFGLGDSILTGANASSADKRWLSVFRDLMRGRFQPPGIAGGEGYVQMNSTYNSPWTHSTSPAPTDPVDGFNQSTASGLGLNGRDYGTSASSSRTFIGTAVDVQYRKQAGGGTFSISIDGASSGAGFLSVATANASEVDGVKASITGLSAGTHTIAIVGVSGTSHVEGAMFYNGDEAKGIRIWDGGHTGINTGFFATTNTKWLGAVATVQPSLVVLMLGTNNYRLGAGTPAAITVDIINLVKLIRAQCTIPPSVLILAPPLPSAVSAIAGFLAYYDGIYQAAGILGDVDVLDLFYKFDGNNSQANVYGLLNSSDLTHPTDKGYQFIADAVFDRFAPGGAVLPISQPFEQIPPQYPSSQSGAWALTVSTGRPYNMQMVSGGAQNETISYQRYLSAGTWKLQIIGSVGAGLGIYTAAVDGVVVGTIDAYAASSNWSTLSLANIAIAKTGLHTITLTVATKNASSTGYSGQLSDMMLTKTA